MQLGIDFGGVLMDDLTVQPIYREKILQAQLSDIEGSKIRSKMDVGIKTPFWVADDGTLIMGQCVCVPNNEMVKRKVLQETH